MIVEIKLSSQSKSSNGNDFIVLLKISFLRFINRLFLRLNMILLKAAAKYKSYKSFFSNYTVKDDEKLEIA